ncbi:inositol polyphosphate kinase-domain-containing protein [Suillus lakei]|nr:inositol polyphosphate kinase-domain-containing protein [Suillus lakei]
MRAFRQQKTIPFCSSQPFLSEINFYQRIAAAGDHDELSKLRKWIPKFLGVLKLEGQLKDSNGVDGGDGNVEVVPVHDSIAPEDKERLVLENVAYGFMKPCILDVKLGTVLYDKDAPPEKQARMIKAAHNTTSEETGVRLTGFQVYGNDFPKPILTPKSYGKSIKKEQLPEGIEMFFPVSSAPYPTPPDPIETSESDVSMPRPGLPPIILHYVLTTLQADLEELKTTISNVEMRMVGGSVLIVYEGDWERASKAISTPSGTAMTEEDEDDEMEVEIDENGQIVLEFIPDEAIEEEEEHQAPLCSLSLIDFAHTRFIDGVGPDEGVLKGIQTMIDLVRQRKDKIAAMLPSDG